MIEITNFAQLIQPYIESKNKNVIIDSYTTKSLVPIGENYGSVILAVEVKLTNGELLQLVAKLNPPSELFKKIFNISIAFKKEAEFYKTIVPILHSFQNECKIPKLDSFSKYYGSRLSLQPNEEHFDEDACLVMENQKFKGFTSVNRVDSYDLPTTEYILRTMAHFHALGLALKQKKPVVFEEVKKHLMLNRSDSEITTMHSERIIEVTKRFLVNDPETAPFAEKVVNVLRANVKEYIEVKVLGREPFNTITHNDLWITNILLKFDGPVPVADRLVDFQMAAYGNPANDVLFFIHSSVKAEIITEKYDYLVDCYYDELLRKLNEYDINVDAFGKNLFLKEIDDAAMHLQLYHIVFMLIHVFLETKQPNGILSAESMWESDLGSILHEKYAKHLKAIVLNYVKNNWV